jgi:predicted RNase H-like HicB family nuclease
VNEITFLIEHAIEGGYNARAIGESIFTQGDTLDEVKANIRDAVQCHFEEDNYRIFYQFKKYVPGLN